MEPIFSGDITAARTLAWTVLRLYFPNNTIELNEDALTLLVANLILANDQLKSELAMLRVDMGLAVARIEADLLRLRREFEELAAREHIEHQPVAGSLHFTPGLAEKGTFTFLDD